MAEVFDFGLQQHKIKMDGKFFENNLFAVAGDTGRRLEVQLLDSNNMFQNTTGISLRLNANVAGQATYAEATLVDATQGLYELDLPNGMLIAPGNWQFQWQIIGANGEKLHSFAFMGSIGSNLSEGGIEAVNFYLNVQELKEMQEDFVSGAFDSAVLETNIAVKLTDLETQYTPKLTLNTLQISKKIGDGVKGTLNDVDGEFLAAIQGGAGTSFNLLSIPQDESVTYSKLTEKFRFRPTVTGVDLNTLIKDGNYYTISPVNGPNGLSGVVNVSNFNDIVIQKFTTHNDLSQVFSRRLFRGTPEVWVKEQIKEVIDIPRTLLKADYNAFTVPATLGNGTNLNTLLSEGYYFIVAGATNVPPTFTGSFFLDVKRTSANFAIQTAYELNNPERKMIRQVTTTTPSGVYKWVNTSQSPQADRNWIAMGDSITGTAFRYFYRTRDLLQVNGTNAGIGGTTMASRNDPSYATYEPDSFVKKTASLNFSTQHILTVFFGTNDYSSNVPLGDINSTDITTFNGAMNVGLENIYSTNKTIDILFITPLWRNGAETPNAIGLTLRDYCLAIIAFCERNNLSYYDAYRKSGINALNHTTFLSDGLHPNEIGGDKLGSCIASAVKNSI